MLYYDVEDVDVDDDDVDTDIFARYVPKDRPRAQRFDVDGVRVGLDSSSHNTVELINISLDTAGTLMCEVSLEAPRFKTVEASSDLTVVLPPHSAPVISPGPAPGHRYHSKFKQPIMSFKISPLALVSLKEYLLRPYKGC